MVCFNNAVNRLKIGVFIGKKKEQATAKHGGNITKEAISIRRMLEVLKIQEMKLQMKSKEFEKRYKITNEKRVNNCLNLMVRLWTNSISGSSLRVRLPRLRLVL